MIEKKRRSQRVDTLVNNLSHAKIDNAPLVRVLEVLLVGTKECGCLTFLDMKCNTYSFYLQKYSEGVLANMIVHNLILNVCI